MKTGCMAGKIVLCVALALALGEGVAQAQVRATAARAGAEIIRIRELTGLGPRAVMTSPGSSNSRRAVAPVWIQLQVQYDTEPEWIEDLMVQFHVLLRNRAGEFTLLKGTVNYVDVARGKGHLACAYVRPAGVARFGDVLGVAVELTVKGKVEAEFSDGKLAPGKPLPQDWWKNEKLVLRDGYVVDKSKTPFALVNFDDYEALK
jgi:hypothetical protein